MNSITFDDNSSVLPRHRGSLFQITLRVMACFVAVGNFLAAVQVGPLSLLGYATLLFLFIASIDLAASMRASIAVIRNLALWIVFAVWLCLSMAVSGVAVPQPPIALAALMAILVFATVGTWAAPGEVYGLHRIVRVAFLLNAGFSILLILSNVSDDALGPRTCAIVAVLGLAMVLSYWRYGHPSWFLLSVATWLVCVMTLSRTAMICGALLFPLSARRTLDQKRRRLRLVILTTLAFAIFLAALQMFPAIENRFFFGGRSLSDFASGNATLDTSGRAEMWKAVIDSWLSTPQAMWIGQGAGTSERAASWGVSGMIHPHNDYLAILHDYGIVGCLIFITAYLQLLRGRWKAWNRAEAEDSPYAVVHSAAFLITLAFAMMMITDNPLEYLFAILPVALVAGSSIGIEIHTSQAIAASPEPHASHASGTPHGFPSRSGRCSEL